MSIVFWLRIFIDPSKRRAVRILPRHSGLPHHQARVFVIPEADELRMSQMISPGPLVDHDRVSTETAWHIAADRRYQSVWP
jgi:hypothetical protein